MLSFHNDPAIKQKYLDRVIAHRKADAIIQGTGWEDGKGCAVGCTLENYDHGRYPIELGLPEWLARLEDVIFEGLEKEDAMTWPEKFLSAIPVGVDTECVRHQLTILRLDRLIKLQTENLEKNPNLTEVIKNVLSCLDVVKKCHEAELNKTYCDWSAAASAAWAAAWAAESTASAAWAARSAARSAESAESAAWAAWAAASAARSAARAAESAASAAWAARSAESAESAARSAESAESAAWAARSAAWKQEAEDLLMLLSNLINK